MVALSYFLFNKQLVLNRQAKLKQTICSFAMTGALSKVHLLLTMTAIHSCSTALRGGRGQVKWKRKTFFFPIPSSLHVYLQVDNGQ